MRCWALYLFTLLFLWSPDADAAHRKKKKMGHRRITVMQVPVVPSRPPPRPRGCPVSRGYHYITSASELLDIDRNLTGNYVLCNDLDISSLAGLFQPIGYRSTSLVESFEGHLDGNGKRIIGLEIRGIRFPSTDLRTASGLFARIGQRGRVSNLRIANPKVEGYTFVGAIAASNKGIIEGCTVEGGGHIRGADAPIRGETSAAIVGALVGANFGVIDRCHVGRGIEVSGYDYVGGLVGQNAPLVTIPDLREISVATIRDSSSSASVRGNEAVGGLVGYAFGTLNLGLMRSGSQVVRSWSDGFVTGSINVGGFVGLSDAGDFADCVSLGSPSGEYNVGGFVGEIVGNVRAAFIDRCQALGNVVTGNTNIGGFAGSAVNVGLFGPAVGDSYAATSVSGRRSCGAFFGRASNTALRNSLSTAYLLTPECDESGGISGSLQPFVTLSYYDRDRFPGPDASGAGRSTAMLYRIETYAGWDISFTDNSSRTIWKISPSASWYPSLRGVP